MAAIKRAKELAARARQTAEARNRNRKSTDTRANSGKPAAQPKPARQTVYYRSKDDAKPVYRNPAKQKTATRPRYTGKGRATPKLDGWYAQPKANAPKKKVKAGDAGIYVRPPDWSWENDVAQLAKDRTVNRIENYTNDYRVLDESPLKKLENSAPEWRRSYREKFGYTKTPHTVMERIQDQANRAVDVEKKLNQIMGEKSAFRDWVDSHMSAFDSPEDKGSTLAQVNRLASLYGAVYPTTQGYTPEQAKALQDAIRNAPIGLQDLYVKYGGRLSPIVNKENKSAYFMPFTERVYGDPELIAADTYINEPYRTHWHEYGHNLDWLSNAYNGPSNYSSEYQKDGKSFSDIIAEDWNQTLRDYWATFQADNGQYNPRDALRGFSEDMNLAYPRSETRDVAPLSDLLSPYSSEVTGNPFPIGFGHSSSYWQENPNAASSEAFADIASASVTGGNQLRYIQAFLPNTYDAYLDMLKQMANTSYRQKTPQK